MSTPEHPATPGLTRKQMRELRNTGSNPVVSAAPPIAEPREPAAPVASPPIAPPPPILPPPPAVPSSPAAAPAPVASFPRPAESVPVGPPPVADSAVDLGVSPLTRRQARQQERIRTASVPVITPEVVAAPPNGGAPVAPSAPAPASHAPAGPAQAITFSIPPPPPPPVQQAPRERPADALFTAPEEETAVSTDSGMHALFGIPREPEPAAPAPAPAPQWEPVATVATPTQDAPSAPPTSRTSAEPTTLSGLFATVPQSEPATAEEQRSVVSPQLGASLLGGPSSGGEPAAVELPPSFDQLLARSNGGGGIPNTLIVSQAPDISQLVAPVTATGEVLVTGSFSLPEGLGSTGHAKGTADGKEVDATLVDGELPRHSSPTPIAASAAISTVKAPGDVIKPPAPEKGSKLMMSLAITAGVLALALGGVLILAFVTGVF